MNIEKRKSNIKINKKAVELSKAGLSDIYDKAMASQLMQEEKHKKADNEDDVGEEVKYNGEEVKAEDEEPTRGRPPKLFTSGDFDTF